MNTFNKKLFIRTVVIPLLCVLVYLCFFMPNRFESSALVVVKDTGAAQMQTGILASLGVQAPAASDDLQLLHAYITSKDLALELDSELALRAHYADSWDFLFGISASASVEDYYEFYRRYIRVGTDVDTGLLAISVQGYSAEFTKSLADAVLKKSEIFINDTGKVIAESEMKFALTEIESSLDKLKLAKRVLLSFQNKHNLVSPGSEGESLLTIIFELEGELAKTEAQLSQQKIYLNADAPKIKGLKGRALALQKEIDVQKRRVIGEQGTQDKLNTLTSEYQNLMLDAELATTLYTSALSAYEVARVQAGKQLKYLVVASSPQLAEVALYPKRLYWWASWMMVFICVWAIAKMVVASVKEHRD